jgi:succinate dehydrogenase / fumarate reductase cytochrome b subunit
MSGLPDVMSVRNAVAVPAQTMPVRKEPQSHSLRAFMNPKIYRNIQVSKIVTYRLPLGGVVSILHRISGALMFILLPLSLWLFETSVSSEGSFGELTRAFSSGIGFVPGWFVKLVVWALTSAFITHFTAGLRHLWIDVSHRVSKAQGGRSALVALVISGLLSLLVAAKILGLY